MELELAIIGAGPAGLTAGIFAVRAGMSAAIFYKIPGGVMATASVVENWPGTESISGQELTGRMVAHAKKEGVALIEESISAISKEDDGFVLITENGNRHSAKAVLIATGGEHKELGAKGEKEFFGKGVSYCVTCDAPLFKGKDVAVIGGGNQALSGAILLAGIARKVYLVHRRDEFRGDDVLAKRISNISNIEKMLSYLPSEIHGAASVEGIKIQAVKTQQIKDINVQGVFICVGEVPSSVLASSLNVKTDERGFITADKEQATNIQGIFAAGDVTGGLLQIVKAAGEGATAALSAFKYIRQKK